MANDGSDIGERLRGRLLTGRQVTTLCAERIHPDALPAKCLLPAIRYEVVASNEQAHLGGASGYAFSRVQFDCYGVTRRDANQLAQAVKDLLHGFRGELSAATPGAFTVQVDDCVVDNQYDRRDPPSPASDAWRYRRVVDFQVSHTTPVPSLSPL